jgi:formylglycine-generating enzyme required for sulfatase activity
LRAWGLGLGAWAVLVLALSVVRGAFALQAPSPRPQAPEDFVEISAGPFTMGADRLRDPMAFDNERPEHSVDVPAFFIARHEVTAGEFKQFAQAGRWSVDPRARDIANNHPVAFVSWTDALAYCRWLEAQLKASGSTPPRIAQALRDGWHVTLPTEAQWEKAARGTDRRRFPWGEEPRRDRANVASSATVPVGSIACPECAHGLSDMAGNVWEWTRSPLQPYPYTESDDRSNLDADALWVMRGGAFNDASPQLIRTTTRGGAEPGARRPFIGFRVVIARP